MRRTGVIGIPRALGYYLHPALWETFLDALGRPVLVSAPTTRATVAQADLCSESEHCLPVKLFDAHLAALAAEVDTILVPRLLATLPGHISCPKLGVLPDCARAQFPDIRIISVDVDENRLPLAATLAKLGRVLGADAARVKDATTVALAALTAARATSPPPLRPDAPRFLIIGHPYNLGDDYLAAPVSACLAVLGVVAEMMSFAVGQLPPEPVKWDTCSIIHHRLGQLEAAAWDGVIQLSSCNCGCDSITGMLYRNILRDKKIPFMTLVLDGHASPVGVETRLEAFVDSIAGRNRPTGEPDAGTGL